MSDHLHACNDLRTAGTFSRNLILSISKIDQHSSFGKNQITSLHNYHTEKEDQERDGGE